MKRFLMATWVPAAAWLVCASPVAAQEAVTLPPRTFRFEPPGIVMGFYSLPDSYIHVLTHVRQPNGETHSVIVVESVRVLKMVEEKNESGCFQLLTLRVTAAQAAKLQRAQRAGPLVWVLKKFSDGDVPAGVALINAADLFMTDAERRDRMLGLTATVLRISCSR